MLPLFDEAEESSVKEPPTKTKVGGYERKNGARKPIPAHLPRELRRYELPLSEQSCACCGGSLHEAGVEASGQLHIIPQKMHVLRHERVKYGCRSCQTIVKIVAMPAQPIPKSMASASTLAHIAVAKYCDHTPLYRQEYIWSRLGIDLDRGTLAKWMVRVGQLVQPIINLLLEDVKNEGVVCIDETTVQVLREKDKKPTSKGYMWVLCRAGPGPKIILFEYDPSRSGRVAERILTDYRGTIVTDGFDGYKRLALQGITRAACWAHVRRKFLEAAEIEGKEAPNTVAKQAINLIGELYEVERRAKELCHVDRSALRQTVSSQIMTKLDFLLNESSDRLPPKSPTGRALSYLRAEWPALQIYLRNPSIPIDNNPVENAIRPFTLGRKNWLFSSSPSGARASANLYSLIETAKANGMDPYSYLAEVFEKLPAANTLDEIQTLLPYPRS
jgi:transposase